MGIEFCAANIETFRSEWSNALIAMSAGLLFGLITMLVQYVGLFMLGFHTGHQDYELDIPLCFFSFPFHQK